MKLAASLSILPARLLAVGLSLPAGNAGIEDAIGRGVASEPTAEELADPPLGEIKKLYLRNVNQSRSALATVLGLVPAGPEGQQSPFFTKLQSIKIGLDQLASSWLESQLFGLIPTMSEVFEGESVNAPGFVGDSVGWLQNLSSAMVYTIARHVTSQNADVTATNLGSFVKLFSCRQGFISLGDWEDEPMPIGASGVMILDAASVVTQLKAAPWQHAKQFLGGATSSATYFARYSASGDGLAVLKSRYAQNQATIDAKFVELKNWVAQQETTPGAP
ncbi:MAG TPA: hypothetical protein VGO11_09060 [Chthoniobacteraceae bacterium]|jgi:hypothetical protein|nr:hypothetical protein [Chthoniobacteraceae bacterium]